MDLDLSILTDDQLVALARLVIDEALRRNPATAEQAEKLLISAHERMLIARAAVETEVLAAKAAERRQIAADAARDAAMTRAARESAAAETRARANLDEERAVVIEAAALIQRQPHEISIVTARTKYGHRALINLGRDRFSREHLVDYSAAGAIKTTKNLVRQKPALAALCARILILRPETHLIGADLCPMP